jgi:hypothetical protein
MWEWGTIWAAVQGIALCAAAGIAWYQIGALRRDQRNWETLRVCSLYDTDPVIDRALARLRDARLDGGLQKNATLITLEMATVLNYLEGIAIGVEQGFYNKAIVRDHLEDIMRDHVDEFLAPALAQASDWRKEDYGRLSKLLASWHPDTTYFSSGKGS